MHAFADALENIPNALAENSGLNPIETTSRVKSMQVAQNNPRLGVDCVNAGTHGEWWLFAYVLMLSPSLDTIIDLFF